MDTNYAIAVDVANRCSKYRKISGIWLVGDMARTGDSKEAIQIVLGVNKVTFNGFLKRVDNCIKPLVTLGIVPAHLPRSFMRALRARSLYIALNKMKERITLPEPRIRSDMPRPVLDIFMMPNNWQDRVAEMGILFLLQDNDSMILNFAETACLYDERLNTFVDKEGKPLGYPLER